MEFADILNELNAAMVVDVFKDNGSGECRVKVEGLTVMLMDVPEARRMLTTAEIGPVPEAGRDQFYSSMLEAMHMFEGTNGASFSIDHESQTICLARQDSTALLEPGQFAVLFEEFVNIGMMWRKMLLEFVPVMKEVDSLASREQASDEAPKSSGFIRI